MYPRRQGYANQAAALNRLMREYPNLNPGSWANAYGDGQAGSSFPPSFQGPRAPQENVHAQGPPPLPPRPDQYGNRNVNRLGATGIGMNRMPSSGLGYSYTPYSGGFSSPYYNSLYSGGIGGYGNRLNPYGGSDYYGYDGGDNFMQMAEESSRQAFQSIESIVQAFGSVSMMLESTYAAVYSSFRAVIGVADHFSRLKNHLAQIISTLALVRTLHWLFRKALYLLGLSNNNPSSEGAWTAASRAATETLEETDLKGDKSSWPILMFLSVVFGAPWLIWRVLSSVAKNKKPEKWMIGEGDHFLAVALYDFQGDANNKELSFRAGQKITLAPKALQPRYRGWILGSLDGSTSGLLPANYIKIHGRPGVSLNRPAQNLHPTGLFSEPRGPVTVEDPSTSKKHSDVDPIAEPSSSEGHSNEPRGPITVEEPSTSAKHSTVGPIAEPSASESLKEVRTMD